VDGVRVPEGPHKGPQLIRPESLELGKLHFTTFAWCHGHLSYKAKQEVLADKGCVCSANLLSLLGARGGITAVWPPMHVLAAPTRQREALAPPVSAGPVSRGG